MPEARAISPTPQIPISTKTFWFKSPYSGFGSDVIYFQSLIDHEIEHVQRITNYSISRGSEDGS